MHRATDLNILVLDDDDCLRGLVLALMREIGFRAIRFATLHEVLERGGRSRAPELIVLDLGRQLDERVHQRLAASFPRAMIVTVEDGEYEPVLETAFFQGPRPHRAARSRRRRVTACARIH
jgi:FixJ family two-component response regulator